MYGSSVVLVFLLSEYVGRGRGRGVEDDLVCYVLNLIVGEGL